MFYISRLNFSTEQIYHSGASQRCFTHILGLFHATICVFQKIAHFNYLKTQENHISLELKSSTGQNGPFILKIFLFGASSDEKTPDFGLFLIKISVSLIGDHKVKA